MSEEISKEELESMIRRIIGESKADVKPLEAKIDNLCAQFPELCRKVDGLAEDLKPSDPEGHRTLDEQLDCPNCRPKIESAVYKNLQKAWGYCATCHYPQFERSPEPCSNCGGKDSRDW